MKYLIIVLESLAMGAGLMLGMFFVSKVIAWVV